MSNSLELFVPAMGPTWHDAVTSWKDTMGKPWEVEVDDLAEGDDAGFLSKCQRFHERTKANVCGYLHSDLSILEHGWDARVLKEFDDPKVAVVGFVGARRLGHPDIYKVPYAYTQLARYDVISNLTDAPAHGTRFVGAADVAVVDSCAVFVRHDFLAGLGGWPLDRYPDNTHCTDLWLCCRAHRAGLRVRMVGVGATHASGGKGDAGAKWLDARGGDLAQHRRAHELLYDDFRDVLPVRIG